MKILYNNNGYCKVLTFDIYSVKILEYSKKVAEPVYESQFENFIVLDNNKSYLIQNATAIAVKNGLLYIYYIYNPPKVIKF